MAYEWGCHAFTLATIEVLELFSNSHMSNSLLYAIAQVGSYMPAIARHLHKDNSSSGELALIRA